MPTELSRAQIESFTAALDARGAEQADAEPAPAAPIQALPVPSITRTAAVLSRFAAVFPGERLPQDITSIPWAAQLQLKDADGELHALLTGQASAELELAVLNGSWSHTAPVPPTREEAAAQLVAAATANGQTNPWAPTTWNLSAQLEVSRANPEAAESLRLEAAPAIQAAQAARQQREAHHQQQAQEMANLKAQARARLLFHGHA